jgi:hypothetical protein
MRVYIQWATNPPTDYIAYDINRVADARQLPRKPAPTGVQNIDTTQGWLASINIQCFIFSGYDHVGFEIVSNTLVVTAWNDGADFGVTEYWGQKWTFAPPAPDIKIQNAINTVQTCTWYGKVNSAPVLGGVLNVRPYEELTFPPNNQTLHGVWMSDTLWQQHVSAKSERSWMEWIA